MSNSYTVSLKHMFIFLNKIRNVSNRPVHLQRDGAVDDGETEHSDPAEQNTPERTRLEVHDEDLQRRSDTSCESNYRSAVDECF